MIFSLLFAIAQSAVASTTETKTIILDDQSSITIPNSWKAKSYPMPIRGSVNFRFTSESLKMAVTSIPESEKNSEDYAPAWLASEMKDIPEEDKIAYDVFDTSTQYMLRGGKIYDKNESSKFKGNGYIGAMMTLTSPGQEGIFAVFNDKKYQCVTTSIIKAAKVSYVISVGSESCSGIEHTSAIAAIKSFVIAAG